MSWATHAIERLQAGEAAVIRPRGHSMKGRVNDGDVVTVVPSSQREPKVNDIVLVKVHGQHYLHLIKAIQEDRCLIGNNRGGTNGWVGRSAIFGVAVKVERPG